MLEFLTATLSDVSASDDGLVTVEIISGTGKHRTSMLPGTDVAAHLAMVNDQFAKDGRPVITPADIAKVSEIAAKVWTPSVVVAFRGRMETRPAVSADDVRQECQRRIMTLVGASSLDACIIKQLNALMRATELVNKRALGKTLTEAEQSEEAALTALADRIKQLRASSNVLEPSPPADYADDKYWVSP